jgi:hypothetical protein
MLKSLAVITVISLAMQALPPAPRGATGSPGNAGGEVQQQREGNYHAAAQTVAFGKPEQPISADEYGGQQAPDNSEHSVKLTSLPPITLADKNKTIWDYVFDWGPWVFNMLLVIVGGLQIWLLFITWKTITRQADLQKFLTRQWVDVGNWSIGGEDAWDIKYDINPERKTIKERSRALKDSLSIKIEFEIFNRTAYPLPIDMVIISIGRRKQGKWHQETFEDKIASIVPPYASEGGNSEKCAVPIVLETEDEVFQYTNFGLYVRVQVRIFFFDAEGKKDSQDFAMEVPFKEGLASFVKYSPRQVRKIGEKDKDEEGQNPN